MNAGRVAAVAAFSYRTNARMGLTRAGIVGGGLILFSGPALSMGAGRGWSLDPGLAFYGVLVALVFGLRSGLEQQREGDLDLFLTRNFLTPVEHAAGLVASLLATWLTIFAVVFIALLLTTDPGTAAWHTASWGLRTGIVVGWVPLIERVMTIRTPLVVSAFAYLLTVVVVSVLLGEGRALELFVVTRREDPASLIRLGLQAAPILALSLGAFVAFSRLEQRLTARRARIVPVRHGAAPPSR